MEFQRLYYGHFYNDKRRMLINDLAREYNERTEEFDRAVCTGPMGKDGILPATYLQHATINAHAKLVLRDVLKKGRKMDISGIEIMEAMRKIT